MDCCSNEFQHNQNIAATNLTAIAKCYNLRRFSIRNRSNRFSHPTSTKNRRNTILTLPLCLSQGEDLKLFKTGRQVFKLKLNPYRKKEDILETKTRTTLGEQVLEALSFLLMN